MLPQEAGNTQCIEVLSSNSKDLTIIRLGGEQGPNFTFDEVFPISAKQINVYTDRVLPLVQSCMEGYNATILAYGQTGSGKTHTIMGPSASLAASVQDQVNAGVIPRAIQNMFALLQQAGEKHNHLQEVEEDKKEDDDDDDECRGQTYQFEVRVQFLEVYGEDIRDLLVAQQGSHKLTIRDVGLEEPEVVGASEQKVDSSEEAILCLTRGMYRRVTGATAMNASSSRSHAIFSLIVEQSTVVDDGTSSETKGQKHVQSTRSKFNFVDLAGSERQKRTKAEGLRLKEGIDINQGLLVLGNVISALGDPAKQGKSFVPYRDSKLTRLLKGSLGGNHKTLMIACVSPSSSNMEESLNCLRYANRAKNIQNHAVVNMDATSRVVSDLRRKMQMLAADLLKAKDGNLSDCTIPIEVIESIADGGDGENIPSLENTSFSNMHRTPGSPRKAMEVEKKMHKLKAENEAYRIQLESISSQEEDKSSDELQKAFVARTVEHEHEIAQLKESLANLQAASIASAQSPSRSRLEGRSQSSPRERSDSPELRRLRAQVLGSMANPRNLDAEVEAEERAAIEVVTKFLSDNGDGDEESPSATQEDVDAQPVNSEGMSLQMEADLQELSNSINAKEDLIEKLLVTQEKFEVRLLYLLAVVVLSCYSLV
jgi:kinesin family protein 4/21/27